MTLFQTLETPTKLAILLVFTIASTAVLADSRFSPRYDGYSGNTGNKWSNNSHNNPYNSPYNNSRYNRFSNRDRWNYSPNYAGNRFNSAWNIRAPYGSRITWNSRNFRRDNWSVNLNLGNSWYGNSITYGIGSRPFSSHTTHTRVIVREPSVVVVREPAQIIQKGRSLLRDLEGNCFERSTDDLGNEIRIQIPGSECNF